MSWATIELEVTTPLFNAGHDPDGRDQTGADATGMRVPSLLGAMRFWFRAMAGAHLGTDLVALREWEGRVFGRAAAGNTDGNDNAASPIQWRIPRQPSVVPAGQKPSWLPSFGKDHARDHTDDRWIVYLLGQGLGNLRNCTLERPYVPPGETIELRLRMRRDDPVALSLALGSLWLTATFGGVGARTRRGFGGIRITGFNPGGLSVPPPWNTLALAAGDGDPYTGLKRVWTEQVGRCLAVIRAETGRPPLHPWTAPPPYPVLGRPVPSAPGAAREVTAAKLGEDHFPSWDRALADVGERWRRFRATDDALGVPYRPRVKTPEWTDVIWGDSTQFALGALGLPVVYKDGWQVNLMDGQEHRRRASPIWIRPVRVGQQYRIFTFGFLSDILPTGPGSPAVVAQQSQNRQVVRTKDVVVSQDDLTSLVGQWLE